MIYFKSYHISFENLYWIISLDASLIAKCSNKLHSFSGSWTLRYWQQRSHMAIIQTLLFAIIAVHSTHMALKLFIQLDHGFARETQYKELNTLSRRKGRQLHHRNTFSQLNRFSYIFCRIAQTFLWSHYMKKHFSLQALFAWNPMVTCVFLHKGPIMCNCDVFFAVSFINQTVE